MRHLDLGILAATSGAATVARSSRTSPKFVLAPDRGNGLLAALWQRREARLTVPQRLDEHVLSYCVAGTAESTIVINGEATLAHHRAGFITFIPADQAVQWTLQSAHEVAHLHLYIAPDALCMQPRAFVDAQAPALRVGICDHWLDAYFRLMFAEFEGCMHDHQVSASAFLDETAGVLISHLRKVVSPTSSGTPAHARLSLRVAALRPFILHRIEDFVESHLGQDIHLDALAGMASMSVGHFLRAFQSATGATPYQYLLERRLDRACALLRSSDEPVSAIARHCGYRRASHFAAIFHLHRGCTPTQFRQRT